VKKRLSFSCLFMVICAVAIPVIIAIPLIQDYAEKHGWRDVQAGFCVTGVGLAVLAVLASTVYVLWEAS
jgi:hypothetical protein